MEKKEPILLKVKEAMEYTGLGRNRLLEMAKIKGFPVLVFPGETLFIKDELPIWFSKNRGQFKN